MGSSYKQCDECGKRALSIATRCPGCGVEFPIPLVVPEPARPPLEVRNFISPNAIMGIIGILVAVAAADLIKTTRSSAEPTFAAETTEVAYTAADTSALDTAIAAGVVAESASAEPAGELRVARTWTHVRTARKKSAHLEAMLMPGDTVYADSLDRSWYRVALEGEVLGYAHISTLTATGAAPIHNQ